MVWLVSATPTPLQKLLHILAYAVLAFLCMWTLDDIELSPIKIPAALAITIATGALLEWYQMFWSDRGRKDRHSLTGWSTRSRTIAYVIQ